MNDIDPTQPLDNNTESQEQKQINNTSDQRPWLWKPGQSGNPNGRPPKGYSITETFQNMLGAKQEVKQQLVDKILQAALSGDMTASKMIWNYMDGMPLQSNDITSKGEQIKTPTHFIPIERDEEPAL